MAFAIAISNQEPLSAYLTAGLLNQSEQRLPPATKITKVMSRCLCFTVPEDSSKKKSMSLSINTHA